MVDTALAVRVTTHTGRSLRADSFLSNVESLLGHRIRALHIGRPTKVVQEKGNR